MNSQSAASNKSLHKKYMKLLNYMLVMISQHHKYAKHQCSQSQICAVRHCSIYANMGDKLSMTRK